MKLAIIIIWLAASLLAIYITDHSYYWKGMHKLFYILAIIALITNAYSVYDPRLNHMIGGVIETNPTFELALILSAAEAICIVGPIAAIHSLIEHIHTERESKKYQEHVKELREKNGKP